MYHYRPKSVSTGLDFGLGRCSCDAACK